MIARPEPVPDPDPAPPPAPAAPADLKHHALGGFAWTFLGAAGQGLVRLVVLALLAHLLEPVHFGTVGVALIVVTLGSAFAEFGVGPAVVQRPGLGIAHVRAGFTLSVSFGLAISAVVWALAPAVAAFFRNPEVAPVIRALSPTFAIQGLSVVAESLLVRQLRFRQLALVDLVAYGAGYGTLGVALALLGWGLWALVCAQLAQAALRCAAVLWLQPHARRPLLARRESAELLGYGGGFTLARVANFAANHADNLVVGRWLGAEALGAYGRAYQLMTAPAMFTGEWLDRVLFPVMARVQAVPDRLARAYERTSGLIALLMLPASGVLIVLAPEVIEVVLGPSWTSVTVPFQILALGLLLRTNYKVSDALVRATGAVYRRAWRQILYAAMVAAGAWIGHYAGLPGVALGVLAAIVIHFVLMTQLSFSLASLSWRALWNAHRAAALLTTTATGVAWAVAAIARQQGLPTLLVLALSLAAVGALVLLLMRCAPRMTLGADGEWMLRTLAGRFAPRVRAPRPPEPLARRPLAREEVEIP